MIASLTLFPFADYWWIYGAFILFVLAMLAIDLGLFHRHAHEVTFRESLTWTCVWISLALLFGWGFHEYAQWKLPQDPRLAGMDHGALANQLTLEYHTGFLVEKALAVDNIFVFVVVFRFFGIPPIYQHRILFFGILGALFFRIIFIAVGAVLLQYHAVVWVFGGFLILTGLKILFLPEKPVDPEKNILIRGLRKVMPVTSTIEGQHFLVRRGGKWMATPLLVALLFIELSDIIFAVDSVPAIFALTDEPLVVFTSNIFAILGLRAMFFMLGGVMHRFELIKYGLGLVLVFVGLKMAWLNDLFGGKFPITWSLGIIALCIGGSMAASLMVTKRKATDVTPESEATSEL